MKKLYFLLSLFFMAAECRSQCLPTVTNSGPTGDYISSFMINSLNQVNSGDAVCDYEVTDTTTTSFTSGQMFTFVVGFGTASSNQYFAIWIDLNGNGGFDNTEMLYSSSTPTSAPATLAGTVVIPVNSVPGRTAMRICTKRGSQVMASEACSLGSYGEFQDYVVTLNVMAFCSGTPPSVATSILCCTGVVSKLFKLASTLHSVYTYSWESSPDNITWTPIPNTNHDYYAATSMSTSALCYRCAITCAMSTMVTYSTPACLPCNPLEQEDMRSSEFVSVYPNPVYDQISINYNAHFDRNMTLTLLNAVGETVKQIRTHFRRGENMTTMDVSNILPGFYLLEITDGRAAKRYMRITK